MKNKFLIFSLLLISVNLFGQELTVDAPNVVTADESFRVVFSANGKISDFSWDIPSDFTLVWGPQTGSSTSVTIVNGKRESVHQSSYTYILQPTKEGKFTLPAATAKVDKNQVSSRAVTIEVVKAEDKPANNASQSQNNAEDAAVTGTVSSDDIFMRMSVSKTNVMKGEPVNVNLKLYTRADIAGFENIKFPTFTGFWSKEVAAPQNIEFQRENVNGKIYNAAVLRKYVLIPQQTGDLKIDAAEMVCQLRVRSSSAGRSIFDDFFDSYQTIRKRVVTSPVTIKVKALPAGAPASFSGGVGDFKISAKFAADSINSNEATSFKVTITGNGNISMLEAPKIQFPSDFEVYDVKTTESVSSSGTSGNKTFEWPVIPRSYGDFQMGPFEYSYYDIKAGKYITVTAPAVKLKVNRSDDSQGTGVVMPGVVRQGVKNIGEDIRYIRTAKPNLKLDGKFFVGSLPFYIIIALIVALYFVAYSVLKKARVRRSDIAGTKNRKANKMARARLRAAEDYMKNNLPSAFYEEVHKALLGYASDKLMMPAADLSKDNIAEGLVSAGVPEEIANQFNAVVADCEQARYAPELASQEMGTSYNEAGEVISKIENSMKNKKGGKGAAMIITFLLSVTLSANAANVDGLWESAADAYMQQDFTTALDIYRQIEGEGLASADLFYNMGNTFYKLGDVGHSVLYYKKALKINPAHSDAANNLAIAEGSALDKIERVPEFILVTWVKKINYMCSSDAWGYIFVALLFIVALLMLGFKFASTGRRRKVSFIFACIVFLFALGALSFSIAERSDALSEDGAVVMVPYSAVKSSPGDSGKSLFILHEGTEVDILDVLGEWSRVSLADGRQGWILTAALEVI